MKGLRVTKNVIGIRFKKVWGEFESKKYIFGNPHNISDSSFHVK